MSEKKQNKGLDTSKIKPHAQKPQVKGAVRSGVQKLAAQSKPTKPPTNKDAK